MRPRFNRERLLRDALRRRNTAEETIETILKEHYPPGAHLHFQGQREIVYPAIVTMNCYGDRLKIRNEQTGKELFIYAYRIHGAS